MTGRSLDLLEPGSKLQDRYKIVSLIGQGGLGSVYLCEDLRLPGTKWALKELRSAGTRDCERAEKAFLREANFLAALRHQCMPMIVDVFSVAHRQYLVMEFIDGQNLAERIETEGAPSTAQALDWTLELAKVLDYLHTQEKPVIFRDLKPENVMITKEGHLKVIDFGLARHFESGKTHDTQSSGTVGYTSPEQWENAEGSDPRSDIFSLGATLYFLLSGKPPSPIYGKSTLEEFGSRFAPELHEFVSRCLEVSPDDRFNSAAEVITELQLCKKAQAELTPFVSQDSAGTRLRSPLKKDRRFFKMLVAGSVLFLLGILLPFLKPQRFPSTTATTNLLVDDLSETAEQKLQIRKMLTKGKYHEAIAHLDGLLTLHPQDAEAHILKNNAYAKISSAPLYRIPVITSLKGNEREGFSALFGWALAQSDINRDRTDGKPFVYLDVKNDHSEPELLLELVEGIVENPKVSILIGPWTSQQALMVAPLVNDGGLPTVTPVSSDPRVLPSGPNIFCVSDTDINKSRALADQLYATGCRKAAVLADRSRYVSRTVAGLFSERFEELGGDIVLQDDYPRKNLDFSNHVDKAKKRGADCAFLSEYRMTPVVSFCRTKKERGWDVPVGCQVAGFSDDFIERGGEYVEDVYLASTYVPDYFTPKQVAFQERFRNTFGKLEATHREAQVYDSLAIAVEALDAVGEDRAKLREYLTDIGRTGPPHEGVSGSFAPSKRLNARPAHVVKVKKGKYELIEPNM